MKKILLLLLFVSGYASAQLNFSNPAIIGQKAMNQKCGKGLEVTDTLIGNGTLVTFPLAKVGIGTITPSTSLHIKNASNSGLSFSRSNTVYLHMFVGNGTTYNIDENYFVSNATNTHFKTLAGVEQVSITQTSFSVFDPAVISAPIFTCGLRTDIHANGGSFGANNAMLQLHTDNAADCIISLRTTGSNEKGYVSVDHATQNFNLASANGDIRFLSGAGAATEFMRMKFDGKFGIGTSAPARTFSTVGFHRYVGIDSTASVDTSAFHLLVIDQNGDVYKRRFSSGLGGSGGGVPYDSLQWSLDGSNNIFNKNSLQVQVKTSFTSVGDIETTGGYFRATSLSGQPITPIVADISGNIVQAASLGASVPIIVAYGDVSNRGSTRELARATAPTVTGTYRIGAYLTVNSILTDILQIQINYTDENGVNQVIAMVTSSATPIKNIAATGGYSFIPWQIRTDGSTDIIVTATLTNSLGSIDYNGGATIEFLNP